MRRRFHLALLVIAAFWLPIQAIAAVAMPFCRHGEAHRTTHEPVAAEHCPMHEQQAQQGHESQPVPDDGHGMFCDDCGFCHLTSTSLLPSGEQAGEAISLGSDFRSEIELAPASNTPEPPQRPPRRTA